MERVTLEVEAREAGKSSAARAVRRAGKIPGVLYGNGRAPEAIAVDARLLREALSGDGGRHAILDVKPPGAKSVVPAILKDYQLDPIRDTLTHIDLLEIRMDQEIETPASIALVGEPEGVRMQGGVLDQPTYEVIVAALPANIPDHIEVDVSGLTVGSFIKLGELKAPEGVRFTGDPDLVIASVVAPTEMQVEEPEEAAEGEEGAAEEDGAEADGDASPE